LTGDAIPIVEEYRGVGIHYQQSPARIEVVRKAIDAVYQITDTGRLFEYAVSLSNPPEARLLAEARCKAIFQIAVEERRERPDVDSELLAAHTAGLDSKEWRSPWHFCTLADPYELAVERETPLEE
jgi:hypothetical protein